MAYEKYTEYQKKAILYNEGNAIVSASAGSGKTTVVIERIIRLITEKGVSVSEILAVTFTNLAASEMKEKLKKAIIKEINKNDILPEEKNRLKKELENVGGADISTIHSFCLNLLKKYFYVVDLDSTFEICDETKTKRLKAEAMNIAFEKLYEENAPEFLTALDVFSKNRSDARLRSAVQNFVAFVDSETSVNDITERTKNSTDNVLGLLNGFLKNYYQNRLKFVYEKIVDIKPLFIGVEHREQQIKELENKLIAALDAQNFETLVHALSGEIVGKRSSCPADKELKECCDKLKKLTSEVTATYELASEEKLSLINGVFNEYKCLEYVYNKFQQEFSLLKRDANLVDFSD